jgi:hypothetical protein
MKRQMIANDLKGLLNHLMVSVSVLYLRTGTQSRSSQIAAQGSDMPKLVTSA